MSDVKSVLALDLGGRRVGAALASTTSRLAAPLMTIDREQTTDLISKVKELVREYNAEVVVVGLPRGMTGQETSQTVIAREFAAELSKNVKDATVVMQDEAGTSLEAEELLKRRGKPYEKADIDAEAAAIILRDYLQTALGATA